MLCKIFLVYISLSNLALRIPFITRPLSQKMELPGKIQDVWVILLTSTKSNTFDEKSLLCLVYRADKKCHMQDKNLPYIYIPVLFNLNENPSLPLII